MKTRAAVAFEAGKPLEIVEVDLEGPQQGEVLVEVKAVATKIVVLAPGVWIATRVAAETSRGRIPDREDIYRRCQRGPRRTCNGTQCDCRK